jgi:transcriptional regulator with XRE-family HTH domain
LDPEVVFGRVLLQMRQDAGLPQVELGFEADLRRTYVSILELGQQQPSLTTTLKLAKALNQSGSTLVEMVETELARTKRKR